jgi:hypothetical protein
MESGGQAARLSGILYLLPVLFVLAIMLAFVALMIWAARSDRGDDDEGGDGRRGGGGGGHREPRPPHPEGEPLWWPEFERQFERYTREREHAPLREATPAR